MNLKNKDLSYFKKDEVSNASGYSFAIVVSNWNSVITDKLYQAAYDTLTKFGAKDISKLEVPGSYELIFGAKIAYKSKPDAIICLGSIIQGETRHFDFISNAVAQGVKDLNISLDIPVIFGVLTDNNMEQAQSRSGGSNGNKGVEAAITAIKMVILNKH